MKWFNPRWFLVGIIFGMLVAALTGCDKFPKEAADAYVCGEPPKQDTFYCKTGTGPPRDDCGIAQPGEFQGVDVITC